MTKSHTYIQCVQELMVQLTTMVYAWWSVFYNKVHNTCSCWTSLVELFSCPAVQSRHHLRTVQMTADGTPFTGSMNTALCDFW